MIKFLIGPALMGGGYIAGSYYGADAEQLVHKGPSMTYAGVENALSGMRQSGTTSFEGGTPVPYELRIAHELDRSLVVTLFFDGRQGAEADIAFIPQNDGRDTLVTARVHGNREVLRPALAGTSKAKLAYAPDWMLNLAMKPLLTQLAGQIEHGETASIEGMTTADAEAQWEAKLTPEQREQVGEWRQYQATRPAVDPSADAKHALESGKSAD